MERISHGRLKQIMHYAPETGLWTRLQSPCPHMVGKPAGSIHSNPKNGRVYLTVFVDGKSYLAHVLAWFYVTGEWATGDVDHENRNGTDNRWANLRSATRAQNKMNSICRRDNACGFKGVSFKGGRWRPRIQVGEKRFYIGSFATAEEAHAAYESAAKKYFGEFARAA